MKIEDLKIKKDFVSSVRINSEIMEVLHEADYSLQKMIDEFIERKIQIGIDKKTGDVVFSMKQEVFKIK